tara:strand:+ start:1203 stop:1808 length:606 start_codon:yes stop_codon:yes gene_type:complete
MLEDQIIARGIKSQAIIDAMLEIDRHMFVPDHQKKNAYSDRPLPIGYNQTISQPYIVAYMTEKLKVERNHKVLEIGTGSGYQAAILSKLCKDVYTIEIIPELAQIASKALTGQDFNNISFKTGDGYNGWVEEAPFDRIIVTAAPDKIPEKLIDQLKPDGRMIIPVGDPLSMQYLWVVTKQEGARYKKQKILPVRFVPMVKE